MDETSGPVSSDLSCATSLSAVGEFVATASLDMSSILES